MTDKKNNPEKIKEYRDKEWLEQKYIKEKLSSRKVARLCNIHYSTVFYQLKKNNINCRTNGEGIHLAQTKCCNLTPKAIEWINGELLGDGNLSKRSNYSARFRYASKYKEYANYVSDTLKSFKIEQSGKIKKAIGLEYNNICYRYSSLTYPELLPIYKKWYPKDKKIVPKDIELTPLVCRQWYIGDGNLRLPKEGKNPHVRLATYGFIPSDVEWLVEKLTELGFKTNRTKDNIIYISTHSTKDFLDYTGKCPVECYQYKFDYKRRK